MKRSGLDIDSEFNTMSLPSKRELEPIKTLHRGKPDNKALERLQNVLDEAEEIAKKENWSQQRALDKIKQIIAEEREGLNLGKFPLNKAK